MAEIAQGEVFLIRTVGGPHPGSRFVTQENGGEVYGWPLPEELADEGGVYVKVSESQLGPVEPDAAVMRGAQYEWREGAKARREGVAHRIVEASS